MSSPSPSLALVLASSFLLIRKAISFIPLMISFHTITSNAFMCKMKHRQRQCFAPNNSENRGKVVMMTASDTVTSVQKPQTSNLVDVNAQGNGFDYYKDYNFYHDKQSSSSSLKRKYNQAGGILYRQSILNNNEIDTIQKELLLQQNHARLVEETTSSVAMNRMGAQLSFLNSETVRILGDENGSISRLVNSAMNGDNGGWEGKKKMILSPDVPVEIRVYEKKGAGMEWHVDDILFDPPQIEIVLTIENNSDCITMWEEEANGKRKILKQVETKPNSAIFLKAGGVRHRVSSLKYGKRTIVKFVYVREDAKMISGAEVHLKQFTGNKKDKKKKGKKKNGSR